LPESARRRRFQTIAPGWRGSAYPGFVRQEDPHPEGGAKLPLSATPSGLMIHCEVTRVSLRDPVLESRGCSQGAGESFPNSPTAPCEQPRQVGDWGRIRQVTFAPLFRILKTGSGTYVTPSSSNEY